MPRLCVVFDLDDTLYLENEYVFSGFRAVGNWVQANTGVLGFSDRAEALYRQGAGNNTFQDALAEVGCKPETQFLNEMLEVYRAHKPDITLPADSRECLRVLAQETELGIVTDGRPVAQFAKYESLGLKEIIAQIVCTGVWGQEFYKPHHRAYEFMESTFKDKAENYVYVADNPAKDFTAPLARGWKVIRIRRSGGLHSKVEPAPGRQPHLELPDLWELPKVLMDQ
jgi:putative hydrolase of the HAD superfamily